MASILYKSDKLAKQISLGIEAARSIVNNHWAEGRCGSISINLTANMPEFFLDKVAISPEYELDTPMKNINGNALYVTANHISFNELIRTPMENGSIVRIIEDGAKYDIMADKVVKITNEFNIHLKAFNIFNTQKNPPSAIIHAYPMRMELVMKKLNYDVNLFMEKVSDISPDQIWTFKKGFEIVQPDTPDFADNIARVLGDRKLAFVPRHGIYSFGQDPLGASDKIAAANYLALLIE